MNTLINTAVAGMLPNTTKADALVMEELPLIPEDKLDKKAVTAAIKAAEFCYDIQWQKDGIEDTQKKLVALKDKVSERVYSIVKEAVKLGGNDMRVVRSIFLSLCAVAETHILAKHIEDKEETSTMAKLIPSWAAYKSSYAKGLANKLNPMDRTDHDAPKYPTGDVFRKAAENTGVSQAGNTRSQGSSAVLELVNRGITAGCAASVTVLIEELTRMNQGQQDKAAKDILSMAAAFHTRTNDENVASEAARKAGDKADAEREQTASRRRAA